MNRHMVIIEDTIKRFDGTQVHVVRAVSVGVEAFDTRQQAIEDVAHVAAIFGQGKRPRGLFKLVTFDAAASQDKHVMMAYRGLPSPEGGKYQTRRYFIKEVPSEVATFWEGCHHSMTAGIE